MGKEELEIPNSLINSLRISIVFTSFFVISVIILAIVNLSVAIFSLQEYLSFIISSIVGLVIAILTFLSLLIILKINNYIEIKEIDKIYSPYYILINGVILLIYNLIISLGAIVLYFINGVGILEIITSFIIFGFFGLISGIFQILVYNQINSFISYYKIHYGKI
jgi:hypothetical protein